MTRLFGEKNGFFGKHHTNKTMEEKIILRNS